MRQCTHRPEDYPNPHYWLARIYQLRHQPGDVEKEIVALDQYLAIGATSEERREEVENRLKTLRAEALQKQKK